MSVIDSKPKNVVVDSKSNNKIVLDTRPNNQSTRPAMIDQLYTVVLAKGQYMGIPPHTYSEAGTVVSSFSP